MLNYLIHKNFINIANFSLLLQIFYILTKINNKFNIKNFN